MAEITTPEKLQDFPLSLIKNMITLTTSGFGVVVALAWNEAIKASVDTFIVPYLGKNSNVVSLMIYATIVTILAIIVTMQMVRMQRKLEIIELRRKSRKQ